MAISNEGSKPAGQRASETAIAAGAFPAKAALALGTAIILLFGAHWWRDGHGDRSRGVDFLSFPGMVRQAAMLHLPRRPHPATSTSPLNGVQLTRNQSASSLANGTPSSVGAPANQPARPPGAPGAPAGISPVLIDDSRALDPFFAQLWTLQQHKQPQVVTVLHYGDSPTTADLITGDVRAILQERFGDAGHGYNLGAKPWAWYGHRDVEISDKGWASSQKDATGVGRMEQSIYGLGGAIFTGSAGAQTVYTLKDAAAAPPTSVTVSYFASPGSGTLTVSSGDTSIVTIATGAETSGPASTAVPLPPGTKSVKLAVTNGTVKLFGADFRRGDAGILYDSLGLNGATTTVISRTFDPEAWAAELKQASPSLIVINYGTNESQFSGLVETLDKELRAAIDKTRAAAPGVPILIMSPMDRGEHSGSDIHTNPAIPQIVAIQQKVAADTHCAFFNTYQAMGGDGTMARWYGASPRLVTADLIHPTPQGAVIVAQLLVDDLYRGFDRWKRAQGIGVVVVKNPSDVAKERAEAKAKANAERKAVRAKALEEKRAATAAKRNSP